jgi:EmrB/QacA subfamily drug resistance transporter
VRSSFIHSAASETRRRAHFAVGPRQHEVSDRSTGAGRPDARSISSDGGLRYATAAGRWVVAATVLGSCMASIDATVVGIALPTIGRDFHAPIGTLQWVVTGYSLTLGAFLLLGGSLGDHYGRRKIYLIGVTWFAASSAACALTPGTTPLIAARVLQGVGAALLTPGSLAILQASFVPDDRAPAIGAWSGLGGVAGAVGPLLGGYLIAVGSWRWIFVINVPIGVFVMLLSMRHIPESRDPTARTGIDVSGALLTTVALAGVTYGLIEGPSRGWTSPTVVVALLVGGLMSTAFTFVERASQAPMLPLGIFRIRQFSITNAVTFVVYGALGGVLFLLPVQLQISDHYSPLESGVALMPLMLIMLLLSARSGRLAGRIGPRLQMSAGPMVVGTGLALLARTTTDASYISGVLPALLVFGLGLAITVAPLTATALGALPDEHSGLASAVNNDVARIAALVAVAVLPGLAGISGTGYMHVATLAHGFRMAVLMSSVLCAAGGVLAAAGVRNPRRASPHGGARRTSVWRGQPFDVNHRSRSSAPRLTREGADLGNANGKCISRKGLRTAPPSTEDLEPER